MIPHKDAFELQLVLNGFEVVDFEAIGFEVVDFEVVDFEVV